MTPGSGRPRPVREPDYLQGVLRSLGNGIVAALDPAVRSVMEARLGHDFSTVRVHSGQIAARWAGHLGALAFTVGDDVVVGAAAPPLDTPQGQRLLAHELTHVVQQRIGGPDPRGPSSAAEQEADVAESAIAHGATPAPVSRGTAVGVACKPPDARHARGHAGEQEMGFQLYRRQDGWIFFEGPSGAAGHGVTTRGFDGVAYNTRTGELHLVDNKSNAATGNVREATAIDPTRNLAKNVDTLITRVEAAKDVPGRIRVLGLLRRLQVALAAGGPIPAEVKLVVTGVGGRTTDISARLRKAGVVRGGLFGIAAPLVFGWLHDKAVEERIQDQANREGYVPRGAPSGEGRLYDLGAWLVDPENTADQAVGMDKRFNFTVWRQRIRASANARPPGRTISIQWDVGQCAFDTRGNQVVESRDITYLKMTDGRWIVLWGDASGTPDLNDIVSPSVSDATLKDIVLRSPCQA